MDYSKVYSFVLKNLKPQTLSTEKVLNEGFDPNVVAESCYSFDELLDNYSEALHLGTGLIDTAAVMLAVNISLKLGGSPIWSYVIGPPSSGKTTLAELMEPAHPYCCSVSKLTGIFSGQRGPKGDYSMLPLFQDRCVIIKDFTPILKMPQQIRDSIFGELRDLYDGAASVHYRSGFHKNYAGVRFGMLPCVTDAIRQYNSTSLGERFLQVEIDSSWDADGTLRRHIMGDDAHIERTMFNQVGQISSGDVKATRYLSQKCHTWGFLDHLHTKLATEKAWINTVAENTMNDHAFKRLIICLSQWVSYSRSQVERDREKNMLFRPRPELGNRLAGQLVKMGIALSLMFQIDGPDENVHRIVRKVAMDSAIGFPLEVLLSICQNRDGKGFTREAIAHRINLAGTSVNNHLANMRELGMIQTYTPKSGGLGRPTQYYQLTPELARLANELGFM